MNTPEIFTGAALLRLARRRVHALDAAHKKR